jgi:serpin B
MLFEVTMIRMNRLARPIVLAGVASGALACGSSGSPSLHTTVETARSSLARDQAPSVSAAEGAELAAGNTAFAVDLYKAIATSPSSAGANVFFSPLSVSESLAMTYAGASGDTAAQLAKALHSTLPSARLHPAFDALDLALASRGKTAQGTGGHPFRLHVVNSLWGQKTLAFEAPFLDTLAVSYGAGVQLEDFTADAEKARLAINGWVSDETEAKIPDLLPAGALGGDTRFVIVNAIYFDARWATPFDPASTKRAPFHRADGTAVDVPLMHEWAELPYAEGAGWQAVSLPYDGGQLSLLAILPAEGTIGAFEAALTPETLGSIVSGLSVAGVTLTFPKFKQAPDGVSLKGLLRGLGATDAFDDARADFSGVTRGEPLVLTDVIHKAFIDLDEDGTEAAAATGVIGGTTSAPAKNVTLTVDRPFLFAIRDDATGTIVFAGRVMTP